MNREIKWHAVGFLPSGGTVYVSNKGEWGKEVNHKYLAEMTPEEIAAIIPEPDYDKLLDVCIEHLRAIKQKIKRLQEIVRGT